MSNRPIVYEGMRTPWGAADGVEIYTEWCGAVTTPGHGGIHITVRKKNELPPAFQKFGVWFEEDCEWAIPVYFLDGLLERYVEVQNEW